MINEEFDSMTLSKTQFVEAVNKFFVEFYVGKNEGEFSRLRKTPLGDYVWKVHDLISEIEQNLEDIQFVERMLLAHIPENRPLKRGNNAAQEIRYHYENYLLRTTKIKDMCLSLISQVMQLNLKKGSNMENQLLKRLDPAYGNFSVIWDYMKKLTDQVKRYRNHLAHNGTVRHRDLALLNAHYNYDIEHKDIINEFRYEASMTGLQRELIEKFTDQTRAYLRNSEQVLKMIYLYLGKPFLDNLQLLITYKKTK